MNKMKRGVLFEFYVQFDEELEWPHVYPFVDVRASVKSGVNTYPLNYERFGDNPVIRFYADTSSWVIGDYKSDVSLVMAGKRIYIPAETYMTFSIIKPVVN